MGAGVDVGRSVIVAPLRCESVRSDSCEADARASVCFQLCGGMDADADADVDGPRIVGDYYWTRRRSNVRIALHWYWY